MAHDRFVLQLRISIGIIVVCIAAAAGAIYYYVNNLSAQADRIVADRKEAQMQTDAVADLASLEAAVPQATQYQAAMNQLLPDQFGLVTFEQWLAQLGQNYGVMTNAAFQGSPTLPQGTTPGVAAFSFSAQGSLGNLTNFLDEMSSKSSGFLLTLNSFNFTSDGTNARITGQGVIFFR